jgi:hypothetical protein
MSAKFVFWSIFRAIIPHSLRSIELLYHSPSWNARFFWFAIDGSSVHSSTRKTAHIFIQILIFNSRIHVLFVNCGHELIFGINFFNHNIKKETIVWIIFSIYKHIQSVEALETYLFMRAKVYIICHACRCLKYNTFMLITSAHRRKYMSRYCIEIL